MSQTLSLYTHWHWPRWKEDKKVLNFADFETLALFWCECDAARPLIKMSHLNLSTKMKS